MREEDILQKPLITEKAALGQQERNEYSFRVHLKANKHQIKSVIEKLFKVKVVAVHTLRAHGKRVRLGKHVGMRADWKKAIVRLAKSDTIKIFEGKGS